MKICKKDMDNFDDLIKSYLNDEKVLILDQIQPINIKNITYSYGTAGLRDNSSDLDYPFWRIGLFLGFLSRVYQYKKEIIGVMITASHNPHGQNGIKIFTKEGYLSHKLEKQIEDFINIKNIKEALNHLVISLKINGEYQDPGRIIIGRDTRESGPRLLQIIREGISLIKTDVLDCGVCSTPMLEYFRSQSEITPNLNVLELFEKYKNISDILHFNEIISDGYEDNFELILDCSNGVAHVAITTILSSEELIQLRLNFVNIKGKVNEDCGSDYVCSKNKPPFSLSLNKKIVCASFDGDADRLVILVIDNNTYNLINGDKLAAVCSLFTSQFLKKYLENYLTLAVITTNYANSSTREYINNLEIPWIVCATGFKNLEEAAKKLDVAILFEPNGHFKLKISQRLFETINCISDNRVNSIIKLLYRNMFGDAVLNLFVFFKIKKILKMTWEDIVNIYSLRPMVNFVVKVERKDELLIDEISSLIIKPYEVKYFINNICETYEKDKIRIFLRPSGTENYIRVCIEGLALSTINLIKSEIEHFLLHHSSFKY